MSKFKKGDRVKIIVDGIYKNVVGTVEEIEPDGKFTVKIPGYRTIHPDGSSLELVSTRNNNEMVDDHDAELDMSMLKIVYAKLLMELSCKKSFYYGISPCSRNELDHSIDKLIKSMEVTIDTCLDNGIDGNDIIKLIDKVSHDMHNFVAILGTDTHNIFVEIMRKKKSGEEIGRQLESFMRNKISSDNEKTHKLDEELEARRNEDMEEN